MMLPRQTNPSIYNFIYCRMRFAQAQDAHTRRERRTSSCGRLNRLAFIGCLTERESHSNSGKDRSSLKLPPVMTAISRCGSELNCVNNGFAQGWMQLLLRTMQSHGRVRMLHIEVLMLLRVLELFVQRHKMRRAVALGDAPVTRHTRGQTVARTVPGSFERAESRPVITV